MPHTLLFAECELELVPREIETHPQVAFAARKRGKAASEILLNSSDMHSAMRSLPSADRRGRPDLVHLALSIATDSPSYFSGRLQIMLHLRGDFLVRLRKGTRPPKDYSRFCGLFEQLLRNGRVPLEGEPLMEVEKGTVANAISKSPGRQVLVFDSGESEITDVSSLARLLKEGGEKILVVGGFSHGKFESNIPGRRITLSGRELLAASVAGYISAALGEGV